MSRTEPTTAASGGKQRAVEGDGKGVRETKERVSEGMERWRDVLSSKPVSL